MTEQVVVEKGGARWNITEHAIHPCPVQVFFFRQAGQRSGHRGRTCRAAHREAHLRPPPPQHLAAGRVHLANRSGNALQTRRFLPELEVAILRRPVERMQTGLSATTAHAVIPAAAQLPDRHGPVVPLLSFCITCVTRIDLAFLLPRPQPPSGCGCSCRRRSSRRCPTRCLLAYGFRQNKAQGFCICVVDGFNAHI